jgi:Fe-S cluster biosynthesis and repair protein YggX
LQESRHDPHRDVPQVQRRIARPGARPYPGAKGQDIFEHVSQKAWADWQKHQTLLINEKRLNMMNAEDRKFIQAEMDKFFAGEDYAKAEGYVPPSE